MTLFDHFPLAFKHVVLSKKPSMLLEKFSAILRVHTVGIVITDGRQFSLMILVLSVTNDEQIRKVTVTKLVRIEPKGPGKRHQAHGQKTQTVHEGQFTALEE